MSYVDLNYKPKQDIVCDFYAEPSNRKTCEAIAAESSIGTWTDVATAKPYVKKLAAKVFSIDKNRIKIAYPIELFEYDNVPQILSSVAGNIFGMKAVNNLRLEDIHLPEKIVRSYDGPKFGIAGIRKILRVRKRPLVGTIVKPKLGLNTKDHAKVAYDAWIGGCDIVKDDENLSNQRFNPFKARVIETLRMRDHAEKETGERKVYMPNVTAETKEMLRRAAFVKKNNGEYVMVDIITCGFSSLQSLRNQDLNLVIHAHRAMHAAITRNKKHGISMLVIAKLARLIGVDQLHTGTIVGKLEGGKEVIDIDNELKKKWYRIKPTFPVCSGGLSPLHVPQLMKFFGRDIIIQMGGGIHGHPSGTLAGARAVRQAVDATMSGASLKDYSKKHHELAAALQKWGVRSYE
ncbi:MAG: type III ribulose-bisphosphate carboxylase [Candidatus Aenigmatarchaeota archaeon]